MSGKVTDYAAIFEAITADPRYLANLDWGEPRPGHPEGTVRDVQHAAWSQPEARAYLTELVSELLDQPHGYLLPFDHLVNAFTGKSPGRIHTDAVTSLLGFGPITRIDGLTVARLLAVSPPPAAVGT